MRNFVNAALILLSFSFASAQRARAEMSWWAALSTEECTVADGKGGLTGDLHPETANVPSYTAYYCTVDTVQKMFGTGDVAGLEKYFESSFAQGKSLLENSGRGMNQWGYYDGGQYFFSSEKLDQPLDGGAYLAVAFYGNEAFRVFANDLENTENGHLVFDDAVSGTAGAWHAVPEPTAGMLLLLGLAGLALRRGRIC